VGPARLDAAMAPGLIPIRIDAGRAFGAGDHPTTQLCLRALERHLRPGDAVLDLGTGTGVLAIAAAKLGAGSVLAVDTDPEAVRVARENSAANGVAGLVRVEQGSLAEARSGRWGQSKAQVVVANILAGVIVSFFDHGLSHTVAPGGMLVVSGFLQTQTPEVRARLAWCGLQPLAQEKMGDWVCLIARSPTHA
jgi:ribosomal protein L11 methyltransferase